MSVLYQTSPSINLIVYCVLCGVAQPCLTLFDPRDYIPPGSSAMGILQARILELVAMLSSRGSCQARDQTHVFHTAGRFSII